MSELEQLRAENARFRECCLEGKSYCEKVSQHNDADQFLQVVMDVTREIFREALGESARSQLTLTNQSHASHP